MTSQGYKVFIDNLSFRVKEDEVKNHFSKAGNVLEVELFRYSNGELQGKLTGKGVVTFDSPEACERAIRILDQMELQGRRVFVREHKDKEQIIKEAMQWLLLLRPLPEGTTSQDIYNFFALAGSMADRQDIEWDGKLIAVLLAMKTGAGYREAMRLAEEREFKGGKVGVYPMEEPKLSAKEEALVQQLAQRLEETEAPIIATIRDIIWVCGVDFALAVEAETQEIEAAGGQLVADGSRRRTIGGVFFNLVKSKLPHKVALILFRNREESEGDEDVESNETVESSEPQTDQSEGETSEDEMSESEE